MNYEQSIQRFVNRVNRALKMLGAKALTKLELEDVKEAWKRSSYMDKPEFAWAEAETVVRCREYTK